MGYEPYTIPHVVAQTQILFFSALAFTLLLLSGIYPAEMRCVNLDADWIYRKGGRVFYRAMNWTFNGLNAVCNQLLAVKFTGAVNRFARNAPARISRLALAPLLRLQGGSRKAVEEFEQYVQKAYDFGVIPVGISVAMSALLLIWLFWVNH